VLHVWLSTGPRTWIFSPIWKKWTKREFNLYLRSCLRLQTGFGQAPYDYLGLPFHAFYESDQRMIPAGEPVELSSICCHCLSVLAGKQIRIAIAFADAGNFTTPVLDPTPVVTLLQMQIILPMLIYSS